MSVSSPSGGGKSANFELNLVPFIDLFSALICFLLMTAAWQNLEVINTGPPLKNTAAKEEVLPPTPDQPTPSQVSLSVVLYVDRLEIFENGHSRVFPHHSGMIDVEQFKTALRIWNKRYPNKKDVLLSTENRAPYKHLITLMDRLIEAGFPEVGITLN